MSTDTPRSQESTGTITGPHDGTDKDGDLDHRYWRCRRCGLESIDSRLRDGCFRCGAAVARRTARDGRAEQEDTPEREDARKQCDGRRERNARPEHNNRIERDDDCKRAADEPEVERDRPEVERG